MVTPKTEPRRAGTGQGWTVGLVTLVLLASSVFAEAQTPSIAARIKIASGTAFVVHQNARVPAQVGQPIYESDTVTTGADGRLGLTFADETRLSLGPDSEVRLNRYLYAPAEGGLAFALRVVRGLATYVSGRIAKLSPDAIRLETPSAIIGVRGTRLAISVEDKK
jgi:hypothetical protein